MAYTSDDLDRVRAARLRGTRSVQFSDRTVTYASDAEMRQVEQDIIQALNTAARRPRQSIVVASKGFD